MCYRCEFCNVVVPPGKGRKTVIKYREVPGGRNGVRLEIASERLACETCKKEAENGQEVSRPWARMVRFSKRQGAVVDRIGRDVVDTSRIPPGPSDKPYVPVPPPTAPQPATLGGQEMTMEKPKKVKKPNFVPMKKR
jgi:hypothetical protein